MGAVKRQGLWYADSWQHFPESPRPGSPGHRYWPVQGPFSPESALLAVYQLENAIPKGVEMHVRWSQDQKKDLWVPSSPAQGTGSHLQGPEHLRHSLTGRRDRANASTQMTPVPELHATVQ